MKRAHNYELRQVKREYLKVAEDTVTKEIARIQTIVKDEFLRFAECQDRQKDHSADQQKTIADLTRRLTEAETSV
jgi:sarcosine oxidase delta subunit